MRIVVFSDTHGNYSAMHKIFKKNRGADLFIFLGDGERELDQLKVQYLDYNILSVSGNCDTTSMEPESNVYELPDGKKIFYTHGHRWGVKSSTDKLAEHGKWVGASIILFGHTHCRFNELRDNMLILNPGSAGLPRDGEPAGYAWIDIIDDKIIFNHVNL